MYSKSLIVSGSVTGAGKRSIKHTHSRRHALIQNLVGLETEKSVKLFVLMVGIHH